MPDTSAIGNALIAKLGSDATLLTLCPNGVYYAEAPPGSTRFVIVTLVDGEDVQQFGGRSYEDGLYSVEARMLSTAGGNIAAAAARIDVLLEQGSLAPAGYTLMTMHRESPVRTTETDDADPSIRWYRRGGQYRVVMST